MHNNIKRHLEKISFILADYNSVPTNELYKDTYKTVLTAVLAKTVEFNLFLYRNRSPKNSFFYSPFLRGICEDLITMKFIKKHFQQDVDMVLLQYMKLLIYKSIQAQMSFIGKKSPLQGSIGFKEIEGELPKVEAELKQLMAKSGLNKERLFPSVEHMAIDAKLLDLYNFLYHATSRMFHFSPNVLLRTGWYVDKDKPTVFSSANFYKYYESFNKFYGAYLLVEFCKTFRKDFGFSEEFMTHIFEIAQNFNELAFFPELITWEEMNLKRPFDLIRHMLGDYKAYEKKKKPRS